MLKHKKRILIGLIIITGSIAPFIDVYIVIQMFFLLIPFGFIIFGTLIYFIISWVNKRVKSNHALFIVSVLPIFLIAQLSSSFVVDNIQSYRCKSIIEELQRTKKQEGCYPEEYNISLGLKYYVMLDGHGFRLEYSRGFTVDEVFDSRDMDWESYNWKQNVP